jgi:hypothetical protein
VYYLAVNPYKGYISYTGGYTEDFRLARWYDSLTQMTDQLEHHLDLQDLRYVRK